MKRREFVTSLVVLGCTAIVPLPKAEDALTKEFRTFPSGRCDLSMDLTPEMLDRAFEYFAQEAIEHLRFCHKRDKKIMDLLENGKSGKESVGIHGLKAQKREMGTPS